MPKRDQLDIPIEEYKAIHCILPLGKAHDLLLRLKRELGIVNAFAHHTRGGGLSSRKGRESFQYREGEIVTLLAPAQEADTIFEFIYRAAGIDQPRGGMLLMERAQMGVPMDLPEGIPDED
jgi:hypothetical protein